MKKIILVTALLVFLSVKDLSAQSMGRDYKTALGVKFAGAGGVTLKHFINNKAALEGIGYFWRYGGGVTGLYEFHGNINGAPGLKWYVGPGAHIGFWNSKWKDVYGTRYNTTYIGVDGVLGLDYKFNQAPINISLDWQPSINFGDGPDKYYGFYSGWGGFALRYTF